MLLVLPIIPSRISHNFYPLFLFYSHVITYYSLKLYFVSDNEAHSLFSSWYMGIPSVIKIDITRNAS